MQTCSFVEISTTDDSLILDPVPHTLCALVSDELKRVSIYIMFHLLENVMKIALCCHPSSNVMKNPADDTTDVLLWHVQNLKSANAQRVNYVRNT